MMTIKKMCDALEITLGEFFSTPEFDALEQEIQCGQRKHSQQNTPPPWTVPLQSNGVFYC